MTEGSETGGEYEMSFKVLMLGESGVGKSCVARRYLSDTFDEDTVPTVGTDFGRRIVRTATGARACMMVWDTAGQERFRSLTTSFYRGAHAFVVVYDVADAATFAKVPYWLDQIAAHATLPDAIRVLVANKIDVRDAAPDGTVCVARDEGVRLARERGMLFFECSAKTRQGVQQAFHEILLKILETPSLRDDGTIAPTSTVPVASDGSNGDSSNAASCYC